VSAEETDPLKIYAEWLAGDAESNDECWEHDIVRDVAKRVERRRAQLDDGISKLIVDLTADSDTLLQTVQHSATSAAVYAATLNVIQRLHDTLTAQGLE
jgi:hypothetical protein